MSEDLLSRSGGLVGRERSASSGDVPGRDVGARRCGRILLVCHAFATPGHTGSFRWRSLTGALARRGWHFDVVAALPPSGPAAPSPDPARVNVHAVSGRWWLGDLRQRRRERYIERERALATGSPVADGHRAASRRADGPLHVPVVAPGQPLTVSEQIRAAVVGTLDALDARVWRRRAVDRALEVIEREGGYALVIATSPEPAAQDAGAALARAMNLPFVAEFRDPRLFGRGVDRARLDPLTRWRERRAELRALAGTSAIVDIAAGAGRQSVVELRDAAPEIAARHRVTIPSGHESAEAGPVDAGRFEVLYSGWLWPFMPLPALLEAAGRVARTLDVDAGRRVDAFGVTLVGVERRFNGVPLDEIAEAAGLAGRFRAYPRLAREEAARLQERAAVLVAFDSVCAGGLCIPSKLYHYARCRGVLLPIGVPGGAMAEEAAKIGVSTLSSDDGPGIDARLRDAWQRWRRGELVEPSDRDGRFDFRHRADEMEALFERVRATVPAMSARGEHS